jgi:osmotically-inducible protein OsmY
MTNVKKITAVLAALAMATALGCASTSKHEGTGEYIDDSVITTKVKAAILEEKTLKSAEINVETFKGTVQLSGFVADPANSGTAMRVAQGVEGVKSVKNDIRVK